MRISEISIRNPVFAWMMMLALIFFGWIGFSRMGVSQMPDVEFPVVNVSITLEGAAPEVIETDVVDVVEDVVMSIEGVREVTSASHHGTGTVTIEFELARDIDAAFQEVQSKITQATGRLPDDVDPPVITKVNPLDHPIMWIGISSDVKSRREMIDFVQDTVKPYVQTVSGVGDVFLGGFIERNFRVWVDGAKIRERELTVEDVIRAIRTQHRETPAGLIETPLREFNIRLMGEAATPEEFARIAIADRGGNPIQRPYRLGDVARVEDSLGDTRRIARTNGLPAVGLGVMKQRGANTVAVADGVRARLEELKKRLPSGFRLEVAFDASRFVKESISELNFTLLLSALLTSLVCWLFLGSFSSTFNVLLAIPTSLLGAFLLLYFAGATLNTFTLLGLTLAVGIVVDDAIIVLENITRHREMAKSRMQSALVGSKEIAFAALAATTAVVAIFLPVAFMSGIIGRFFFWFGITITVAVSLSLLEALTLTPMRCSQFLEVGRRGFFLVRWVQAGMEGLRALYAKVLPAALRWRWAVVTLAAGLFAVSLLLVTRLRAEFSPSQDQSILLLRMQTPAGSSIEYTDGKMKELEAYVQSRPETLRYFALVGSFEGGAVDTGMAFVTLTDPKERGLTQMQFADAARNDLNKIQGAQVFVQDLSMSGFTAGRGYPVEFSIQGPEWDKLGEYTRRIMDEMRETGLYRDIDTDYRVGVPEIRVYPDRPRAAARGVDVASIGQTINALIGGIPVAKYTKAGRRYDVRVRLEPEDRKSPGDIGGLSARNDRGEVIPLKEVVRIVRKPALQSVHRRNRERAVTVFANVAPGVSQAAAVARAEEIGGGVLPAAEGYRAVLTGGTRTFRESFLSLLFALALGIVVAYMVLGSEFNSFVHPFSVLFALPFCISGGLLALWIGDQSVNVFSLIGLLLLIGIVQKNSILLVDFTNQQRARGLAAREALLEACPTRLRPILMTLFATVSAALPPALAIGPGAETRIPMAVVVIGGVFVSTLMTLFVVPCAYEILSPLERRKPTALSAAEAA